MKNKALIGIDLKNDIMKNESGATGCVKSTSYDPANWVVGPQIVNMSSDKIQRRAIGCTS